MKFRQKEEQPEKFLVKLLNLALHAFSDPIPLPITPAACTDTTEFAREAAEHQANRDRQRFAEQERTGYVMRLFKKGMPNYIRAKLLEKEDSKTSVQYLCTIARQQLILRELCPVDELSGINAIESKSHSYNHVVSHFIYVRSLKVSLSITEIVI